MKTVNRQPTICPCKFIPAWAYLLIAFFLYVLVCLLLGHGEWILSVLTQNAFSDLTGETPRMLSATYFDVAVYNPELSEAAREGTVVQMAQAILPQIPAAFLFSSMDSFITDYLKQESLPEKVICFLAAYVLQALIAVSCTEPVTWMDALVSCTGLIVTIWLVCGIFYYIFNVLTGNSDIHSIVNDVVSVMMAALYPVGKEIIKLAFLTVLFSVSLHILTGISGLADIGLTAVSAVLTTLYYIALNRLLDKAADAVSDQFILYLSSQTDVIYRKFFVGSLFCFIVCMMVLASAIRLSILL